MGCTALNSNASWGTLWSWSSWHLRRRMMSRRRNSILASPSRDGLVFVLLDVFMNATTSASEQVCTVSVRLVQTSQGICKRHEGPVEVDDIGNDHGQQEAIDSQYCHPYSSCCARGHTLSVNERHGSSTFPLYLGSGD